MNIRRALNCLLILLLLFAQQAAYAHAVTHLAKEPPAEQLGHSKLCDKCVSFEKMSGVVPTSVSVLVSLDLPFVQPPNVEYLFGPRTVTAFHSRAPPVYL
jgi:hypothetical protein